VSDKVSLSDVEVPLLRHYARRRVPSTESTPPTSPPWYLPSILPVPWPRASTPIRRHYSSSSSDAWPSPPFETATEAPFLLESTPIRRRSTSSSSDADPSPHHPKSAAETPYPLESTPLRKQPSVVHERKRSIKPTVPASPHSLPSFKVRGIPYPVKAKKLRRDTGPKSPSQITQAPQERKCCPRGLLPSCYTSPPPLTTCQHSTTVLRPKDSNYLPPARKLLYKQFTEPVEKDDVFSGHAVRANLFYRPPTLKNRR
jgi:hypothetical protein